MKSKNSKNMDESEIQKEIDQKFQDLIDRKKSESDALKKMLNAILEKEKEEKENNKELKDITNLKNKSKKKIKQ